MAPPPASPSSPSSSLSGVHSSEEALETPEEKTSEQPFYASARKKKKKKQQQRRRSVLALSSSCGVLRGHAHLEAEGHVGGKNKRWQRRGRAPQLAARTGRTLRQRHELCTFNKTLWTLGTFIPLQHAPSWPGVYIREQYDATARNFSRECTAAFTVSPRGS
ncbi:hypothetical protein INR49_020867 [Caranx melampygus]|nr:hypothetical protein INR49_020867 [Caranx melampygus]